MSGIKNRIGGMSDGGLIWLTALDVNFIGQPTQTLAPDGSYTIAGFLFTKINSANEAAGMVLTNGVGITVTPAQATTYTGVARTLPALTISLPSIISTIDYTTRIRVWLYITSGNWARAVDGVVLSVEGASLPPDLTATTFAKVWSIGAQPRRQAIFRGATFEILSAVTAHDVYVYDTPFGITGGGGSMYLTGTWAGGWPAASSLNMRITAGVDSVAQSIAGGWVQPWSVLVGAQRAGSVTAFQAVLGALKIEYQTVGRSS